MIYYLLEDVSQSETTENRGKTEETRIILYSNPQKDRTRCFINIFCTIFTFFILLRGAIYIDIDI